MLRLTWYDPPQLHAGDVWQVTAKVRPPWSYQNPGGFDYERWLLAKHLHGTGYVREGSLVTRAFAPTEMRPVKQQIRQWLVARESPHAGVTFALLTGDGSLILPTVWENFRATGTVHLVVVSGLHVGIVAGAAFALGQLFARAVPGILLWAGARRFATLFAVLIAGGYVAFSGFGLPAVRAWIMTSIMLIAMASGRRFPVAFMFTIALTGILIWDPLAVHQQGFWLSFSAVGGLIWYFSPQLAKVGRVRQLLLMQTVLLVVMVPLLAGLNGVVPLISPLANLLVVPMVTLLVLPLSFLTGFAVIFAPSFADVVFTVVEFFLQIVDVIIQFFSQMPQVYAGEISTVEMLVLGLTASVLLAAPSMRRLLGVLPLWLSWSASVDAGVPFGEFRVTVLDVGQGSSIVIDTSAHRLLFDAAPRYPGGFDLGEAAVVPALVATGSSVLDVAVLSHDDIDHTGGFAAIHRSLRPLNVWAAESITLPEFVQARDCRVGVHWQWDGVDFRFLHPTAGPVRNDNEGSCVLLVDNGHHRLLLPGDIGRVTERQILRRRTLNVDVLLAPHHGSNASSSNAWVLTLQPAVVLISAPRRSQYGHPHPAVVDRYRKQGARVFVTGLDGALQWRSWTGGQVLRWRSAKGAYWTNQNPGN
jgi:competence protein ComEC